MLRRQRLPLVPGRVALLVAWLALGTACVARVGRLAVFMLNPARHDASVRPESAFYLSHSCLTSHFQAARLARSNAENLYDTSHYLGVDDRPTEIEGFQCDIYLYPPTALLLPRLMLTRSSSFRAWRVWWFFIELAGIGAAVALLARWVNTESLAVSMLAVPIVLVAPATLLTLQIGNVHPLVFAAAALAMLAFEREAHPVGGALLAWSIATKLFPGILLVVLLLQRRWRAAAWTSAWLVLLTTTTLLVVGTAPFRAFVEYQLPRLANGEALAPVFAYDETAVINDGLLGLAGKLAMLGLPTPIRVLPAAYVGLLVLAAFVAAGVRGDRRSRAVAWLALLQLVSLQAPFVPAVYSRFGWLWMFTVMLVSANRWRWSVAALLVGVLVTARQDWGVDVTSQVSRATLAMLQQVGLLVCTCLVMWRGRARDVTFSVNLRQTERVRPVA